jgi:3-oxoacyl-[acyl-carrier protein] reductase
VTTTFDGASLRGRKAFVTGASRGIGAAIAVRLARDGAAVAVGYERSAAAAHVVVDDIVAGGSRGVAVQMDARDAESVRRAVDVAAGALSGLDILVNNAGIMRDGPVEEMTLDDVDAVLDV